MPGDNQHGLMQDLLTVPDEFKNRPLHGLIEAGKLKVELGAYRPRLLGTTPGEAVSHLIERLNLAIRNARGQVIPILHGVFANDQAKIEAARLRAATVDAQVSADALHTIFSIAAGRFVPEEQAQLERIPLSDLTPLEVMAQSYFPQYSYFSNPYFGFPVRDAILEGGTTKRPLVLHVKKEDALAPREFTRGFGLGTHSRLTYALPAKVYDAFECHVGLHPQLGKEGKATIRIFADGIAVFQSGVMTGEDPAVPVRLPIWRVNQLQIVTEAVVGAKAGSNYIVIGDPVILKAKAPPLFDQERTR